MGSLRKLSVVGITVVAAAAALTLAPSAARAEDRRAPPRVRFRGEIGPSLGAGEAPIVALATRLSASWGWLLGEASLDFGGYVNASPREYDFALLAGVGTARKLGPRWEGYALALGGMHALETSEPRGSGFHGHALPAIGARVGVRRAPPPRIGFLTVGLSTTVVSDLRREHDFFLREEVGGVTVLVSATVGIGY